MTSLDVAPSPVTVAPGVRVLVAHEWLVTWAGSERCLEQIMQLFPSADLVVGVVADGMRDRNAVTAAARETWLARLPGARHNHRWFLPLQGLAFGMLPTDQYDLVISSSHAFAKMVRRRRGAAHVCYCYSPPRYLWDLHETYRAGASAGQRFALGAAAGALRAWDRRSARRVDHFIGISSYIARRIERCYGRRADVVYPPVTAKPGAGASTVRGDYLLHLGRLVPYKRIDLAIAAAEKIGVRLVVAGDGPDRPRLERLAGRHTTFVGEVSEEEAGRLLSECAAFVFCAEEDFGIAPLEANAHGAPVVALARGGLLETMVPGQTAELFEQPTVDDLSGAIERALARRWSVSALRANAARFSPRRFRAEFLDSLTSVLPAALLERP